MVEGGVLRGKGLNYSTVMSHVQYPLCRPSDGPFDTSSSADLYMIRSAEAVRLCVPDTQLFCTVSELS